MIVVITVIYIILFYGVAVLSLEVSDCQVNALFSFAEHLFCNKRFLIDAACAVGLRGHFRIPRNMWSDASPTNL